VSAPPSPGAPAGAVGGPGLLEVEGPRGSVLFRRVFRHPIEDVWDAITDPKQVEAWFMARVDRDSAPGGRLTMEHPGGIHAAGRVLAWNPPRTYEYEWNLPPRPNLPEGESSIVRWELSPTEHGTLVVLSHRLLTRPTAERFSRGLSLFLERLAAHLDGAPMPTPPWTGTARASEPKVQTP
jgi:uncharacterized protein YndB with AHSA1/START domain